jgi:diguanylate cyclase (GGDEF)-like protein
MKSHAAIYHRFSHGACVNLLQVLREQAVRVGALLALILGLAGVAAVGLAQTRAHAQQSVAMLESLAAPASVALADRRFSQADQVVTSASAVPNVVSIGLLDRNLRVVAHSDPTRFGGGEPEVFAGELADLAGPVTHRRGRVVDVAVPVETRTASDAVRWGVLVATVRRPARTGMDLVALLSPLLLSLLAAGGCSVLIRSVLRPLDELEAVAVVADGLAAGHHDLRAPETGASVLTRIGRALNVLAESVQESTLNRNPDAERRARELEAANTELERINQLLGRHVASLADAASTDGLTGLANHRTFQEDLARMLRPGGHGPTTVSLLMIDVDHFKSYNDTHGHPAGDEVLKQVAEVLMEGVRDGDLVARYGGEEFVVILPETSQGAGELVAERLREHVEAAEFANEHTQPMGQLTVSIGLATFPDAGLSPAELISAADQALYQAKRDGRNRVWWDRSPEELLHS